MERITRRGLLQGGALLAAASLLETSERAQAMPERAEAQKESLRFVHATDLHIQPELGATEGVALAVKKILSLNPRPDFVVTGGDHVMDALAVSRGRADEQFKLLAEALKPLEMPLYYTVGNHDVFGWSSVEIKAGNPGYGKQLFEEKIAADRSYRSFDVKGRHFIILDSIVQAPPSGWKAEIDDAQMQWLKDDLKKTGKQTPVVIVCHVPILTVFMQYTEGSTVGAPDTMIVRNGKEVRDLFKEYNVKAVLQGHTHVVEECIYTGTHYITSGAVCGDWWKGPRLGVHPEGFAVFDLDGDKMEWEYVPYGWKARAS